MRQMSNTNGLLVYREYILANGGISYHHDKGGKDGEQAGDVHPRDEVDADVSNKISKHCGNH